MKKTLKTEYAVKMKNIKKIYKKNGKNISVLDNISYQFEYGKMYCIYGKSGVGKTTLIKIIGGLIDNYTGSVEIDGLKFESLSINQKAEVRNKIIGFIFQDYSLIEYLTAVENVLMPIYFENKDISKAINILKYVNISNRAQHFPKELSGGEQQRVAIARALINDPKIILADEPTNSLDKENSIEILKILKNLALLGKCVIVVSHDSIVKEYSDVNLILDKLYLKEVNINEK